jgi:23S rRNA (cytosine1962-C5)-methyltransferase
MRIPILYCDDHIVVVDKPAGVPTHAVDALDPYPSDALRITQRQLGTPYLAMHQRLDAETSGVLLFSARPDANPALAAAFEGRDVRKTYLALTHGAPRRPGMVDAPIVRDRGGRYRIAAPDDRRGQPARTRYRLLGRSGGAPEVALLEVVPETGRSHQIRVHLAHAGAPVLGDPLYGPAQRAAPRLCLHAHELELPHPVTGERMAFTSPPPAIYAVTEPDGEDARVALALAASGEHVRAMAGAPDGLRALMGWAAERRAALAADAETNIYRLIHGGADGLPGLTADRYGDVLVASLYDDGDGLSPRPVPPALLDALAAAAGFDTIYVKYRPRQASRLTDEQLDALAPTGPAAGLPTDEFVAHEDGLAYIVRPGDGLNAGLYPDMREGRGRVRAWSAGRRVLNCFAYTCGFGVAATAGGAQRVLNLDLSKTALARGQGNYRANGFEPDPYDFVFGDVFDWLRRLARRGDRFDLVILDPPGFSTAKSGRFSAARDYGELASLAARCVSPDGLLLACCNVAELPWRKYRDQVLNGVKSADRTAEVAGVYHEPALDYPHSPPVEPYLKMLLLRLA